MGWWSAKIMGGDTPMDCLGNIADVLEAPFDNDEKIDHDELVGLYHFKPEKIKKNLPKLLKKMNTKKWYDKPISLQVLGIVMMFYGVPIEESLKKEIVQAAHDDDWYKQGDSHRVKCINGFVKQIREYQGGRWEEDPDKDGNFIRKDSSSVRFIKEK